jgi:arabinose-5-phosphate isomerase
LLDKEQILEDKRKRLGATIVVDDNEIVGIITDGDIRHMLEKQNDISSLAAKDIISKNPIKVDAELLAFDVLTTLKTKGIGQLIAQDSTGV